MTSVPTHSVSKVMQVGDGRSEGTTLGVSATDKVSLHGAAPVVQASFVAQVSTSAPTQTSPFGFQTSAQQIALVAAVNSILTVLINKGLMAAS